METYWNITVMGMWNLPKCYDTIHDNELELLKKGMLINKICSKVVVLAFSKLKLICFDLVMGFTLICFHLKKCNCFTR